MIKKIILIFLFVFTMRVIYGQDIGAKYITYANSLFDSHDYLFAAQLYKLISEISVDSNLVAEALYKFKKCGDNAAFNFMSKYYMQETFRINKNHMLWDKYLQPVFEKQLNAFRDIGINIECGKLFDLYCTNEDYETLNTLASKYANTKWGETAAFDKITFRSEFDMDIRGIISQSINFLNRYPESKYKFKVYSHLAKAYSDLWNLSISTDYVWEITEEDKLKADEYRLKAIEYYQKIVDYNRSKKNSEKENVPFNESTALELKESKSTSIYYFFGD